MAADPASPRTPLHLRLALWIAGLPAALYGLLGIGLFGAVVLSRGNEARLHAAVGRWIRDDAYYCFDWACSVVEGQGPRVGGGAATSGVHLLWECVLMIPALVGRQTVEALAAPLGGLALLGAALLLGLLVRRQGGSRPAAWCTALLLAGHPLVAPESLNGQETGLGALALAWLLWEARASTARFGIAAVLATLARSDLFLFVVALAWQRSGNLTARVLGPMAALAAYFAANLALTGRFLQDSAEPMSWLFHEHFRATDPDKGDWLRAWWWWGRPVALGAPFVLAGVAGSACLVAPLLRQVIVRWPLMAPALAMGAAAAMALGVDDLLVPCLALGLAVLPLASADSGPPPRQCFALLLAAVGLVVLHSLVRWYPRDYYWVPIGVAGIWALGRTLAGGGPRGVAVVWILGASFLGQGLQWFGDARGSMRSSVLESEQALDAAALHLDDVVPEAVAPGQRIGAFNSGHLTWRLGTRVVNLDGVVNRPAFEALRAGRLRAWLDEEGIGWLCDNPQQFGLDPTRPHACGRWFGSGFDPDRDLTEWARFVAVDPARTNREGTERVSLYRLGGQAPRPTREPRLEWLTHVAVPPHLAVLVWVGRPGEQLVRELPRALPDGEETRREVIATAIPGVPVVLALRSPMSEPGTARIFVAGREDVVLEQYDAR